MAEILLKRRKFASFITHLLTHINYYGQVRQNLLRVPCSPVQPVAGRKIGLINLGMCPISEVLDPTLNKSGLEEPLASPPRSFFMDSFPEAS